VFPEVTVRKTPLVLVLALTSSACYQYFPVHDTDPLPEAGAEIRIHLESPQSLDLGTMTINDVSRVEGHVRASTSDTLSLFSSQLRTFYGLRQHTNGAVFDFDRSQFAGLDQRKIVAWKTAAAIGITTVGLAILMNEAIGFGGGSEPGPPPVDGSFKNTANIPLLRLLVPLMIP
jgi:hypothetical protein